MPQSPYLYCSCSVVPSSSTRHHAGSYSSPRPVTGPWGRCLVSKEHIGRPCWPPQRKGPGQERHSLHGGQVCFPSSAVPLSLRASHSTLTAAVAWTLSPSQCLGGWPNSALELVPEQGPGQGSPGPACRTPPGHAHPNRCCRNGLAGEEWPLSCRQWRALWSAERRTGRDCGVPTPGPGTGLLATVMPSSEEQGVALVWAPWHQPAPGPPSPTPEPACPALIPLVPTQLCRAQASTVPLSLGRRGHTASVSDGDQSIHCGPARPHLHQLLLQTWCPLALPQERSAGLRAAAALPQEPTPMGDLAAGSGLGIWNEAWNL